MPDPALDVADLPVGVALVPGAVELLGCPPELHDEVAGQVLRLCLSSLLPPKPYERGFVVAHDDPGVRAADKRTALDKFTKTHCIRRHLRTRDSWKLPDYRARLYLI